MFIAIFVPGGTNVFIVPFVPCGTNVFIVPFCAMRPKMQVYSLSVFFFEFPIEQTYKI
jgi:hypothetical protein